MGINPIDLKECIVEPILKYLDLWSPAVVNLLIGTAAQESGLGHYLRQEGGPALGIYQMEPATHDSLQVSLMHYSHCDLRDKIMSLTSYYNVNTASMRINDFALVTNLNYATAMARFYYLQIPGGLPFATDIKGLAQYWKQYYNTPAGKGTVEEFMANFPKVLIG